MSKPRMEWVLVLIIELGAGGERQGDPEVKHRVRGRETWVWVLEPLLSSCVTLSETWNVSASVSSCVKG